MIAIDPQRKPSVASRKERADEARSHAPERSQIQQQQKQRTHEDAPAAGAHSARHLINEDATPGAGALPSHSNRSGREVDGGAG